MYLDNKFSKKIVSLRRMKNLQQAELAEMIGVSKNRISDYENNKAIPNLQTIIKMSNVFKVPIDYFYYEYKKDIKSKIMISEAIIDNRDKQIPILSDDAQEVGYMPVPQYIIDNTEKYFYYKYKGRLILFEFYSLSDYCDIILAVSDNDDVFKLFNAAYVNEHICFKCGDEYYKENELKILGVMYTQIPYRKFILDKGDEEIYG